MEQQMWHNFVTTQTQLQLNSKLEFDKKMTLDHHQSHFHVQHNCSVEVEVVLSCRWGCDNNQLQCVG